MKTTSLNQVELVGHHLLDAGHLTPAEAKEVYGIRRLAARVYDLMVRYNVRVYTELKTDAVGARYASYYLDPDHRAKLKRVLS